MPQKLLYIIELLRHLIFIAYISTITGKIIGLRFVFS